MLAAGVASLFYLSGKPGAAVETVRAD